MKRKGKAAAILICTALVLTAGGICVGTMHKKDTPPEISYTDLSEEHIAQDGNGIQYADNELIVTVKEGVKKREIEKLADQYGASVGGYIEVAGTSQWILDKSRTHTELKDLVDRIQEEENVDTVVVNYVGQTEADSEDSDESWLPYSPEWDQNTYDDENPGDENWYLEAVRADQAWELLSRIPNVEDQAVRIGLIDTVFDANAGKEQRKSTAEGDPLYYSPEDNQYEGDPDLDFKKTFYNPPHTYVEQSAEKKNLMHGSQVASVMAATFDKDKENAVGISGIYPYGKGNLYGVSRQIKTLSSLYQQEVMLALLLQEDVKVINMSYDSWDGNMIIGAMENTARGREIRNTIAATASDLSAFLRRYLNRGYDFVLVTAAGNKAWNYSKAKRSINSPTYYVKGDVIKKQGQKEDPYGRTSEEKNKWREVDERAFCGAVDAKYGSFISSIDDPDIRDRIIIVGSCMYSTKEKSYYISDFSRTGNAVDLVAPGENIKVRYYDGTYQNNKGTSFSAPLVAGTAAMMWTANPDLTGAEIKNLLISASESRKIFFQGRQFGFDAKPGEQYTAINFNSIPAREYPILDAGAAVSRAKDYHALSDGTLVMVGAVEGEEAYAEIIRNDESRSYQQKAKYTDPEESLYIQAEIYDEDGNLVDSCSRMKNWRVNLNPGTYSMKVKADGYESVTTEKFEVETKTRQTQREERIQHTDNHLPDSLFIGFTLVKSVEKHVEIVPRQMTWTQAEAFCKELGGNLAVVNSETDNEKILELLKNPIWNPEMRGNGCWLGAAAQEDKSWQWCDGTPLVYENWSVGNPDGKVEAGAEEGYLEMIFDVRGMQYEIFAGSWNDTIINDENVQSFACEWTGSTTGLTREQEEFLKSIVCAAHGSRQIDFQKDGIRFMTGYLLDARCFEYIWEQYDYSTGVINGNMQAPTETVDLIVKNMFGIENGSEELVKEFQKMGWHAEIRGDTFVYMPPSTGFLFDTEYVLKRFVEEEDTIKVEGSIISYAGEDRNSPVTGVTDFTMHIQKEDGNDGLEGIRLIDYKEEKHLLQSVLNVLEEDALNCTAEEKESFSLNGFSSIKPFTYQEKEYLFGIYMNGSSDNGKNYPHFVIFDKETGEMLDELVWGVTGGGFFDYQSVFLSNAELEVVQRENEGAAEFAACFSEGLLDGIAEYFKILTYDGEKLVDAWNFSTESTVGGSEIYENGVRIFHGGMTDPDYDTTMIKRLQEHHIQREALYKYEMGEDAEQICKFQASGKSLYGTSDSKYIFEGTITDYTALRDHWNEYLELLAR